MKRLLLIVLFVSIFMISNVCAANIIYVSQTSCGVPTAECSCFDSTPDYDYCIYLSETLGHDVYLLSEGDVRDASDDWDDYYPLADMIFLGDVSTDMADMSTGAIDYCTNINSAISVNDIELFSTGINNYRDKAGGIKGCIFNLDLNGITIPDFVGDENTCNGNVFRVMAIGTPITTGFEDGFEVYSSGPGSVNIIDRPGGHIGISCDPAGDDLGQNTYAIIHPDLFDEQVCFWGFNDAEEFNTNGWTLFERAINNALGDGIVIPDDIDGSLTTNSDDYQPGDTIEIEFEPTTTLFGTPEVIMIYPDESETTLGDMTEVGDVWGIDFLIHDTIANGTYILRIDMLSSPTLINKTIDIIPCGILRSTDKTSYQFGEDVKITIDAINKYSTDLEFTTDVIIEDPNGDDSHTYNDEDFSTTLELNYTIQDDAIGGKYTIDITITDSDGRIYEKILEFSVKSSGDLIVTPKQWSEQVSVDETYTKTFSVKNNGTETITGLTITPGTGITADKTSLTLTAGETKSFTASAYITEDLESSISLSTETIEYVIDVEIVYSDVHITDSLLISPASVSIITIDGKTIEKTFELENIATVLATISDSTMSDDLKDIITIDEIPDSVGAEDIEDMVLTISTDDLDSGTYSGSLKVISSVGNDSITFNIEILGDYTTLVPQKITELETYLQRIDKIKNKEGGEDLVETYDTAKTYFEKALEEYEAGNYELASTKYSSALSGLNNLQDDIEEIELRKSDYGWIIWLFAIIIIIAIIGIVFYKYKDRIKIGGSKKQEQDEYYTEQDGEYRTDYY